MSNSWLKEWTDSKIELALRLDAGECGGSYAEAVIVLCCVLSGIATDVWPGRHQDRKRFVELLVKYAGQELHSEQVSVPLLVGTLRSSGDVRIADSIRRELMPLSDTRVITGDDVDKSIDELAARYPTLSTSVLKKNSYACVLYEEVRSGFVHEYRPGERSDSWAMGSARQNGSISYINRADKPDRLIYFNVSWLANLVREIVNALTITDPMPVYGTYNSWWLDT